MLDCECGVPFLSFTQNNSATSVFLNGEFQNGMFNVIVYKATISPPITFTNPNSGFAAGVPRPPGQAFTYPNRMLNADPLDVPEGLGLVMLGLVNIPTELSFFVGSLDGSITTANQSDGKLFLANLNASHASQFLCHLSVDVQLYSDEALVQEMRYRSICPEPSTLAIAATCLVGLSCVRRRFRPLPA